MQRNGSPTTGARNGSASVRATLGRLAKPERSDIEAGINVDDNPKSSSGSGSLELAGVHISDSTGKDASEKESQKPPTYDGWMLCAKVLRERDERILSAWVQEADGSLTFAALFSGVVTAFIIESYHLLSPDLAQGTLDTLKLISQQMNGTPGVASTVDTAPFEPRVSDIIRNVLLFASLLCALVSSALSIFVKSYSQEAALDPDDRRDPRQLAAIRVYNANARCKWRMQNIVTGISSLLQLAVVLFMLGIVLFVWQLGPILRNIVTSLIIYWFALTLVGLLCALWFPDCPFKSTFSRILYEAWQQVAARYAASQASQNRGGLPFGLQPTSASERQWAAVYKEKEAHECEALSYAFGISWPEREIETLFPCVSDLPPDAARSLVKNLVVHRLGERFREVANLTPTEQISHWVRLLDDVKAALTTGKPSEAPKSTELKNLYSLVRLMAQLKEQEDHKDKPPPGDVQYKEQEDNSNPQGKTEG